LNFERGLLKLALPNPLHSCRHPNLKRTVSLTASGACPYPGVY
jgi:hypothetical protein